MKKFLLFVSALVLAAACSAPPANHEAPPAANANAASTPAAAAMTEAGAIAKEKSTWDAIKNKDYAAFAGMLDEDQLEVTSEGVNTKASSLASVKEFEPSEVVFSDWKFLPIDKDAFVIVYTAKTKGKYKGKEFAPQSVHASSAWVMRDGKWLAIYHQESAIKPAPPATPAPKAAASPKGTPPTATTGPDPVANEKIVWELFKTNHFDAFGELLASDFFEVEPDGVYGKADAVKMLAGAGFDASKAELSDWKTLKLDDDAMLVTYVFNLPGMPGNGERLSSIWVRREGKWLALFHQGGTPVTAPTATAAPKEAASPVTKAPAK